MSKPQLKWSWMKLLKKLKRAFANPNKALLFNLKTVATFRSDGESVNSKLYPYPMGVTDFVNAEVKKLLGDGIIRPSKSLYNNPEWVVDKKGHNGNKKKSMVILGN